VVTIEYSSHVYPHILTVYHKRVHNERGFVVV
jgi:hypothetical protein